jgi:excisionase family DNA binding protein
MSMERNQSGSSTQKVSANLENTQKKRVLDAPAIGERLLTLREAAEVLRLSTRTVREYVKRGEIRGKIIGNRWRFRRADLDAFFENAPSEWDFGGKGSDRD